MLLRSRTRIARISRLAIHPDYYEVGAWLISAAEAQARELGRQQMQAEMRIDNYSSMALLRDLGYTIGGTRQRYYPDGADAFVRRKSLRS